MRVVIALGGNALLEKGKKGSFKDQVKAAEKSMKKLVSVLKNNEVVITHGNGPQVGNLLIQQEKTKKVPPMPLFVCDAMTQGELGYIIQRAIPKATGKKNVSVVTRVVVDKKDLAFRKPSKPIGPFYSKKKRGMVWDSGRGYRRVVPSPEVKDIKEKDAIKALMEKGFIVIAGGGGGIPVTKRGEGVEAVIDKDRLTQFLANEIDADTIIFITSTDAAYTNFGTKNKMKIKKMGLREAGRLLREGQFAEGSMKPKIESAVKFLIKGGKKVVICSIDNVEKAVKGKAGTTIVKRR